MTDDLGAIKDLYAQNAAALSAGDVLALSRLYESDAIQLPPCAPALIGWAAIRAALEGELQAVAVAASVDVAEVGLGDGWAFARGSYRTVARPRGGGAAAETVGNWLDILRRQPDGSWKIARSTWSNKA